MAPETATAPDVSGMDGHHLDSGKRTPQQLGARESQEQQREAAHDARDHLRVEQAKQHGTHHGAEQSERLLLTPSNNAAGTVTA